MITTLNQKHGNIEGIVYCNCCWVLCGTMIASGGGRGMETHCFLEFGCCCCCCCCCTVVVVAGFLVFAFEDFLLPDDGVEDDGLVTREEESLIPFVGSLVVLFFGVRLVVVVVLVEEFCAVLCSVVAVALDPSMMVTLGVAEDLVLAFPLDLDGEVVSLWTALGERCVTGLCWVCS